MSEERDQPEIVEIPVEGVADEANAQGDDPPQLDENGDGIADPDDEEIEYEGKTFTGPKGLKEAILRQSDYTRKTQELAESRRTADAEVTQRRQAVEQQAEAQAKTLEQRVQLATLDSQLAQFNDFDWTAYEQNYGAGAVATAMATWRQLESQQTTLKQDITAKEQEHRLERDRTTDSAIKEAEQVLAREVAGFGQELVGKVAQTAHAFGISAQELRESFVGDDGKADTRMFKLLAEVTDLRAFKTKHETATTKAKTAEKVAAVTPAATVNAKASGYKAGLNDDLPIEEWVRRANAEAAKQRR